MGKDLPQPVETDSDLEPLPEGEDEDEEGGELKAYVETLSEPECHELYEMLKAKYEVDKQYSMKDLEGRKD